MSLRAGDWVEVRSKEEILRTLDQNGRLDKMPFMPQMFQYCGQRFQVSKRAHKTCDTINFAGGRSLPDGIHLEDLRCDGESYGGCAAACRIFWKEAWLNPVAGPARTQGCASGRSTVCTEADVEAGTRHKDQPETGIRYTCQATEALDFTTELQWWDPRQYIEDYASGNAGLWQLFTGAVYACYFGISRPGRKFGRPLRWLYDRFQKLYGGVPFPRYRGSLQIDQTPPRTALNLQAGEYVRVKSYEEILATLDTDNKYRGLSFDAEMVPYCGKMFRIKSRVTVFVNEKTGMINKPRGPAFILEAAVCKGRYSGCRMHCPREVYPWWREAWLERVADDRVKLEPSEIYANSLCKV